MFLWAPPQFPLDLARVDGITPVMPIPIFHMRDQAPTTTLRIRLQFIPQAAQRMHDVQVGFLVPAADVVGLSRASCIQQAPCG